MAPTRILHIFPSFAAGGAQMRMAALVNHFGSQFAHTIVALDNDTACRDRLDPTLDITFPTIAPMSGSLPSRLRTITASLRTIRPDLLITSNWGSIEWAIANRLFVRTRHIHTEDGFGRDERDRQIPRRVLTRRLVLGSSTTIVPSRTLLDTATKIWRLPATRLHYIPNGIDLVRFAPAPPLRPQEKAIVGCVAALRSEKNLGRLIRACALAQQQHDFDLVILGEGPERATLEALAAAHETKITFLGARRDPAPFYRDLTLFALSSDTEQMPLSVMEAMASGLPVATTNVGDIARMVAPINLPYLTPRDDHALAEAIGTLLANPALRQSVGTANRHAAEAAFDLTTMADQWAALMIPPYANRLSL